MSVKKILHLALKPTKYPSIFWSKWQELGFLEAVDFTIERFYSLLEEKTPLAAQITNRRYKRWLSKHNDTHPKKLKKAKSYLTQLHYFPLLSIVMSVDKINLELIEKSIDSVVKQVYENWELHLITGSAIESQRLTNKYSANPKIKIQVAAWNEVEKYNLALKEVKGEFITFLQQNDELSPLALYSIIAELNKSKEIDVLYSDEDKIDIQGDRYDPFFKPDWDKWLLLSYNYINNLCVVRESLVQKLDGFRKSSTGAHYYDLILRLSEIVKKDRIRHLPFILYHHRILNDTATSPISIDREVVQEHLDRLPIAATVIPKNNDSLAWKISFQLPLQKPRVSIIIPTRDRLDLLEKCISGIVNKTNYNNYEIIIVDNGSIEPETLAYFDQLKKNENISVLRIDEAFNWSRLNNLAAKQASGQFICLLNNDIEPINSEWLSELVVLAMQKDVGAVGAKLLYPNDTIQHASVLIGMGGLAGHPYTSSPKDFSGYFNCLKTVRSVSCVTGACLLMSHDLFDQLGGFDENLAVAYNDVDLCLRIMQADYDILWTPYAELYHYESATRGSDFHPEKRARFEREKAYIKNKHPGVFRSDRFYNPNLDFYLPYRLANKRRVTYP